MKKIKNNGIKNVVQKCRMFKAKEEKREEKSNLYDILEYCVVGIWCLNLIKTIAKITSIKLRRERFSAFTKLLKPTRSKSTDSCQGASWMWF